MKIIDNIKRFFNVKSASRLSPAGFTNPLMYLNNLVYDNTELPTHDSIANTCMEMRSIAIANIEWNIRLGDEIVKPDHWLYELINEPNTLNTRRQFFMQMQKWYDVSGNIYIYVPDNTIERTRIPRQMLILPSSNITIKLGTDGIDYYKYRRGNSIYELQPESIIHIANQYPNSNIQSEYLGVPVIDSIKNILDADQELSKYLNRHLANDEIGPLYMESENEWSEKKWQHFVTTWNEKLPNHRLMGVMGKGNKLLPLTSTGVQGQKNNIKDIDEVITKKIAAAFGVPLELILTNASNYATAKVAQYRFISGTIEPLAQLYAEIFTKFFRKFDAGINIDIDKKKYIDEEIELKRVDSDISNGLLTINEVRSNRGMEEVGEIGDRRYIKNSVMPIEQEPEPDPEQEPKPEPEPEPEPEKRIKNNSIDKIDKYYIKKQLELDRNEDVLSGALAKMFGELKDSALSNISDKKNWNKKHLIINRAISADEFMSYYDKYIPDVLKKLIIEIFRVALSDINIELPNVPSELSTEIDSVVALSADKIITIKKDFINDVKKVLENSQGKPVDKIEESINEFFKDYERNGYKTRRIAQTTSTTANGSAQRKVWQKYTVRYVWLTQRDGNRVRPSHQKLDGVSPDSNGKFITDDDGTTIVAENPGGFGSAANDINCRCVLRPRQL